MQLKDVTVLGDPHLGRRFKTGVPLHRIGEREKFQWQDFETSLSSVNSPFHINMGDLFDKRIVSPEIVLGAAQAYGQAAENNPHTTFVVIMGNHDVSRDVDQASSFDLFEALVSGYRNIVVVKGTPRVLGNYGFVPYSPFRPTTELVRDLPDGLTAVFGHWDIQDWGGDNVIPTKLLKKKKIPLAISGHDHLAREEKRDGVQIIVTGSMQPYTHAEDPESEWYITVTLEELETTDALCKNVRVLLREGEVLPDDLDCLSLTAKRITEENEAVEVDTSDFENLDLSQLLANALGNLSCTEELLQCYADCT